MASWLVTIDADDYLPGLPCSWEWQKTALMPVYLDKDVEEGRYRTKTTPCPFLGNAEVRPRLTVRLDQPILGASLNVDPTWSFIMAEDQKEPTAPPKKNIVRCDKNCTYVYGGQEPRPCKSKCAKEAGHVISCKCRAHEMQ